MSAAPTPKSWVVSFPDGPALKNALARIVDADHGRDEAENSRIVTDLDDRPIRFSKAFAIIWGMKVPQRGSAKRYAAFLSYSRAADGVLAPALRDALQQLTKPWWRLRALRVFRDDSALSANPGLWSSIVRAMGDSEFFILLASPEAKASAWVDREIEYWLAHRSASSLLIAVTAGEIGWDRATGDFDATTTCVPAALRGKLTEEPRWVDLRPMRGKDNLSLRDPRFAELVADLAAPLHGVAKDDLIGADVRSHRLARRLLTIGSSALAVLTILAVAAGAVALRSAINAREQSRLASARQLIAQADLARERGDTRVAARFGLAATAVLDNAETRSDLLHTVSDTSIASTHSGIDEAGTIAMSPTGPLLAASSDDGTGTVVLWDISDPAAPVKLADLTGETLRYTPARPSSVRAVAFSPNGYRLASTSDSLITLWDITHPAQPRRLLDYTLDNGSSSVASMAFSPDGHTLAASGEGRAVLWDLDHLPARGNWVTPSMVTDDVDALWDDSDPSHRYQVAWEVHPDHLGPNDWVESLAFSPDGHTLATAARGSVSLWDLTGPAEPRLDAELAMGDTRLVSSVAFSPKGQILATSGGDVLLWDLSDPTQPPRGNPIADAQGALAFSADGQVLATSGPNHTVRLWDLAGSYAAPMGNPLIGPHDGAGRAVFTPDGRTLAAIGGDGTLILWDLHPDLPRTVGKALTADNIDEVAFAPDGLTLVAAGSDVTLVNVTDPARPQPVADPLADMFYSAAFAPTGHLLVTSGVGNTVVLWNAAEPARPSRLGDPLRDVPGGSFLFDRDGRLLVTVGLLDGGVRLWDIGDPVQPRRLGDPLAAVGPAALAPDGRTLVTADDDGQSVIMWDITDPARPQHIGDRLHGDGSRLESVAFAPDGRTLAVGGQEGTVLWDLTDRDQPRRIGDPLTDPAVSSSGAEWLAFSPDGQTLAAGYIITVSLWDISDLNRPWRIGDPIASNNSAGAFAPGGHILATAGLEGVALWDLTPVESTRTDLTRRACAVAERGLTRDEWNLYLPGISYEDTCPAQ